MWLLLFKLLLLTECVVPLPVFVKPNFDNQATTRFWGWVGSKTNLTCIANGNPEPVIEWHKEGQNLASINGYLIKYGNSSLPTRSISYLIPTVDNGNVGSVFGSYSCKASNKIGENTEQLTFEQARVPGEVGITMQYTRATMLGLTITPPAEDGGQAVTQYLLKYNKLNNGGEEKSRTIDRVAGEAMTKVDLVELDPNTHYSIKVYAINNVGSGAERNFMERTADYSEPDRVMVKSPRMGANAYEYTLSWDEPFTGGADIANYIVEYAEALEVNTNTEPWAAVRVLPQAQTENIPGQASTSVVLDNLKKNTFYQAKIKAVNRIGTSDETTFIFRTGSGVKPNFDNQATTRFWGWVGSKTNLTCIANGNPEPVIEWHKEGQNLASVNDYVIIDGNSGLPTRSISYLIPTVDNGNVGSVFGSYSCKASNKIGENTEQLTFEQARVPGEVGITVPDKNATKLGLAITPPAEDGGQAVTQYLLKYNKLNNGEEEKSRTIDRVAGEAMTKVELEELDPNTQYSIKVYAINNVGSGAEKNFMERTADYMGPSGEAGSVRAGVAGMVLVVMVTACLQLLC
ncbi:fasciclin-2-like [Littorina saxatilis]|uniref:fasciclin-2-like n=1 Tax=Littorina saxatilis TaxID=31220 RepID=UPI0038B5B9E3